MEHHHLSYIYIYIWGCGDDGQHSNDHFSHIHDLPRRAICAAIWRQAVSENMVPVNLIDDQHFPNE